MNLSANGLIVDSGNLLFGLSITSVSEKNIYMKKSIPFGFDESMPGFKKNLNPGFREEN